LIEFLVALVVSTMIAGFLIDDISQIHRFSTKGEKQIIAAAIAQEVIDSARDTSYANLQALKTRTHILPINSGDGNIDPAFPRPLLLDLQNLTWTNASQANRFFGLVTERIEDFALVPNTVKVTVTVEWKEDGDMARSYKVETLISEYGVHS
jgi:hypothetical protein